MIKIIKNTMVDPIEKTCDNCHSIFTFNYEDIRRETSYDILKGQYSRRYIVCPVCKGELGITYIKAEKEG